MAANGFLSCVNGTTSFVDATGQRASQTGQSPQTAWNLRHASTRLWQARGRPPSRPCFTFDGTIRRQRYSTPESYVAEQIDRYPADRMSGTSGLLNVNKPASIEVSAAKIRPRTDEYGTEWSISQSTTSSSQVSRRPSIRVNSGFVAEKFTNRSER
jgi:hypothetical protein